MDNVPPAVELQQIDRMLARLEADRAWLLARRGQLLAQLGRSGPAAGPDVPYGAWPAWQGPSARRRETDPPTVQNVLLGLGGVLLAVAVTAFTVVSWGHLGTAGRAAVLGLLTLAAVAAPVLLLRRSLTATAEVIGCLGLVLLALDAYALRELAFPSAGWAGYGAAASAVLALLWSGYGMWLHRAPVMPRAVPAEPEEAPPGPRTGHRLRLPLPLAVCLAQLPLSLWAVAASADAFGHACALIATAAFDLVTARRCPTSGARRTAGVGAAVAACLGTAVALGASLSAPDVGHAARAAVPLLAASVLAGAAVLFPGAGASPDPASGFAAALRRPGLWWGALCGAAVVAATGGVLRAALPADWTVVAHPAAAAALLLAAGAAPRNLARGVRAAGVAVHAAALLWALPFVALAVAGPLGWTGAVWSGAPDGAAAALAPHLRWPGTPAVPVIPALAAAVAFGWHRRTGAGTGRAAGWAAACGVVLAGAAVAVLPVSLDLALPVALLLLVALTGLLLLASATLTTGPAALASAVFAVVVALGAGCWSLAEEPLTHAVLGGLLLAFTAAATAPGGRRLQPVTACAAAVATAGLVAAAAVSLGLPGHLVAFAVLPVAAATAYAAARLRPLPAALPVECTAYAVVCVAVATTAGDAPVLATALALAGVIAAGTALRPDRRRSAGIAATALFVAAAWVRLAAWGVEAPEAYTLPVTVPALAVGLLQRRDPQFSSWTAYGPGLAVTLLPSLIAAWGDPDWLRPALLGTAALAVTLAGARWRLKAPLLLGGAVVALLALHELAPYIVQVVDGLPRWLPPALAGLLLLALGTTYEQRLRDARRIRRALGKLR